MYLVHVMADNTIKPTVKGTKIGREHIVYKVMRKEKRCVN